MAESRIAFMLFINTTPNAQVPTYELVGDGVTELSISYNPQSSTKQYIHQDTASSDVTGYQPNAPVTAEVVKEDAAFQFINGLRKKLPVLSKAYTDIVLVDVFETASGGLYPATKQPVSIQFDTYGGPATDPLSIGYTINWRGNGIEGTFSPSTKAFTEGSAPAVYSISKGEDTKVEV